MKILTHVLANVIVDSALVVLNWRISMDKALKQQVSRRWVVNVGLTASICTCAPNVTIWVLYLSSTTNNYMLLFCLVNVLVRKIPGLYTIKANFYAGGSLGFFFGLSSNYWYDIWPK